MTTKLKLLMTLMLSIAVIGGGGLYLYDQFTSPENFYPEVIEVNSTQYITPSVDLGSISSSAPRRSVAAPGSETVSYKPSLSSAPLPTSGVGGTAVSGGGTLLSSTTSGSYTTAARSSSSESLYSGGGGSGSLSLLAYGGRSSGSSSSSGGSHGGSISGSSLMSSTTASSSTLMGAPAVGNGNTTQNTVIVDPGGDPDESEIIPVGDGLWVLLILAGVYVFFRRKRV